MNGDQHSRSRLFRNIASTVTGDVGALLRVYQWLHLRQHDLDVRTNMDHLVVIHPLETD